MRVKTYALILLLAVFTGKIGSSAGENLTIPSTNAAAGLYSKLDLGQLGLDARVFEEAFNRWSSIKKDQQASDIIVIADLSQSSKSKRLYIIDIAKEATLFHTYVAHGRNTGDEYAPSFSNEPSSYKSSLGFYMTGNTYEGKHGLSLRLQGLDKGINDFAESRAIVMHGADYVSESFITRLGRLGRSQGFPAVSKELSAPIINTIKNGTCLFIYHPDYSN
jgi:hypothetical protein